MELPDFKTQVSQVFFRLIACGEMMIRMASKKDVCQGRGAGRADE
jgi:hypothetical protein